MEAISSVKSNGVLIHTWKVKAPTHRAVSDGFVLLRQGNHIKIRPPPQKGARLVHFCVSTDDRIIPCCLVDNLLVIDQQPVGSELMIKVGTK